MDIKRYGAYQPVLEDALYLVPKDAIVPRYTFWYKAFGPVGRGSGLGDEKSRAPTRLSNRREQLIKDDKFSSILKASEITRQEPQKFPKVYKKLWYTNKVYEVSTHLDQNPKTGTSPAKASSNFGDYSQNLEVFPVKTFEDIHSEGVFRLIEGPGLRLEVRAGEAFRSVPARR
jgi:hypothetical protein